MKSWGYFVRWAGPGGCRQGVRSAGKEGVAVLAGGSIERGNAEKDPRGSTVFARRRAYQARQSFAFAAGRFF